MVDGWRAVEPARRRPGSGAVDCWRKRTTFRQCSWRSADTASRRARVFRVNRSSAGDFRAGLSSSPAFDGL